MTIFSGLSAQSGGNSLLLAQIKAFFQVKVNVQGTRILDQNRGQINSIERDATQWRDLKDDLKEPLFQIERTLTRFKSSRSNLDNLISTVNKANLDPEVATNALGYRAAFDSILNSVRSTAENTIDNPNLLGKDPSAKLVYPVSPTGGNQILNGRYVGSDYYITDSSGKRWQPDRVAGLLRQYDSYPESPSEKSGALQEGVRLDSFDAATEGVTFTINSATAAIESFSGTITREGTNILDAWLYDGLKTQAGRDRALADLKAAKTVLELEERRYQVARTTVNFHRSRADANVDRFQGNIDKVLASQAQELVNVKDSLDRQFRVAQDSLIGAIALRREYSNFFLQQRNDPLIKALFDIRV